MRHKPYIKALRVRQLYAQGLTSREIADRVGTSFQSVAKLLNLRDNPDLQRTHRARVQIDRKLAGGENVTLAEFHLEDVNEGG